MSKIGSKVLEIIEHTDKTVDELTSTDLNEYETGLRKTEKQYPCPTKGA